MPPGPPADEAGSLLELVSSFEGAAELGAVEETLEDVACDAMLAETALELSELDSFEELDSELALEEDDDSATAL